MKVCFLKNENKNTFSFFKHLKTITLKNPNNLQSTFAEIEELSQKYYLAGYFSYELGYALNPKLQHFCKDNQVLLKLGVFERREDVFCGFVETLHATSLQLNKQTSLLKNLHLNIKKPEYLKNVDEILGQLKRGESYQVNYTGRYNFDYSGDPADLFNILYQNQPAAYSALMDFGDEWVLSFSPELFFAIKNNRITMQPMKGTVKRGKTLKEDQLQMRRLKQSAKERAENIMIVDLIRNDLGKICKTGSIEVTDLFRVQKLKTILQMTSTIAGDLRKDLSWLDFFRAVFPCGSVTGAPKLRTMEIIKKAEKEPRGVYCGAVGWLGPDKECCFNVPIRTVSLRKVCHSKRITLSKPEGRRKTSFSGKYGTGGGITVKSSPDKEWEELKLKAKFLTVKPTKFQLIETMLFDNGIFLLNYHLKRLKDSAKYFDFKYDQKMILAGLKKFAKRLKKGDKWRIRMLVYRDGSFVIIKKPYKKKYYKIGKISINTKPVNSDNVFLYHKTTKRQRYNRLYKKSQNEGLTDTIFVNEKGQITEGCVSNIIINRGGELLTPPITCGLLAGTYRQFLIDQGMVKEKILYLEDLNRADKIFVCNSVWGINEVSIV